MSDHIREIVIAIYDDSGEISSIRRCGENQADMQCSPGELWVEVDKNVSDETHYIDVSTSSHQPTPREPIYPSYSVDGLAVTFSSLPIGAVIGVAGQELIADGDDEVEFDVPGTYRIALSHPRYLGETLEVTVG
ncbi:hypothetical protein QWY79_10150 [Halomonas sabkhae]|uniref:hypothetical protein n=1 Tax=Halomonas sabkhae TaxID=626223 RepID=UPI0025B2A809|nr:hypothetical protein [Halomonas sabkhae]MDN3525625.1 hypothetical protein [Halomonas sabkhae]